MLSRRRGYFPRRYRGRYSRAGAAYGRTAGGRAAAGSPRKPCPQGNSADERTSFGESLQLRRRLYAG